MEVIQRAVPAPAKKISVVSVAARHNSSSRKHLGPSGPGRLAAAAIKYAVDQKRKSVTIVHKGNIMKYTEGAFRDWSYELAKREFGAVEFDGGPWCRLPQGITIKDSIADITLQQVLTRPEEFDVIAT